MQQMRRWIPGQQPAGLSFTRDTATPSPVGGALAPERPAFEPEAAAALRTAVAWAEVFELVVAGAFRSRWGGGKGPFTEAAREAAAPPEGTFAAEATAAVLGPSRQFRQQEPENVLIEWRVKRAGVAALPDGASCRCRGRCSRHLTTSALGCSWWWCLASCVRCAVNNAKCAQCRACWRWT